MANTVSGRGTHIDTPLSGLAIKAFAGATEFIAPQIMPIVNVGKQSDKYYIIDKASWMLTPSTFRAPKTSPKRIEWKSSSDSYYADNYAIAVENSHEDLANADSALELRNTSVEFATDGLLRDYEIRVANQVTSGTNLGSYVALAGNAKWGDYINSTPLADVTTGHAFIRQNTGLVANTAIIDQDTLNIVRRHPELLDMYKYTRGGMVTNEEIAAVFNVQRILVGLGVKNTANEGTAATMSNIWGNNLILARIEPVMGKKTRTFGLSFRWRPAGIASPMTVSRYNDPDPGKKVEVIETGYYQDEKIVASELAYGITSTL